MTPGATARAQRTFSASAPGHEPRRDVELAPVAHDVFDGTIASFAPWVRVTKSGRKKWRPFFGAAGGAPTACAGGCAMRLFGECPRARTEGERVAGARAFWATRRPAESLDRRPS